MVPLRRSIRLSVACILALLFCASSASAGGGPENVLLLVNSRSWESRSVANHFAALRNIPPSNVVLIDWTGDPHTATIDEFRTKILQPALTQMAQRELGGQIDYIVYSAGFPTAIDLAGDGRPKGLPRGNEAAFKPTASINGATFFWQLAMAKSPSIVAPNINRYFRHPAGRDLPTHGFSAWQGWDEAGQPATTGGMHYYLSTVLAVIGPAGTKLPEAFGYLERSAAADGTRPKGTIYFAKSADAARSGPRHGLYPEAVAKLQRLGVRAQVVEGNAPIGKRDVQGLMMGVSSFDWKKTGSTILPGAICDNLTSFGGVMKRAGSQTSLAEYLRYGAAGASGTVVEPLNTPLKFPHPDIHAHYAAGSTLAEAFYQSIAWPFQVLIVGDPLCRPWARIPTVAIGGVKEGERVRGKVALKPSVNTPGGRGVARFELIVDGRRRDKCLPGEQFTLDTTSLPDGYHELRIVAVESGPIETQGRAIAGVMVDNRGKSLQMTTGAEKKIRRDRKVEVTLDAPGAERIVVTHHGREVGRIAAAFGKVQIAAEKLGLGRVTLHAVAYTGEGEQARAMAVAKPLEIEVIETARRGK